MIRTKLFIVFTFLTSSLFLVSNAEDDCDAPVIPAEKDGIDGSYIVVMKEDATEEDAANARKAIEGSGGRVKYHYARGNRSGKRKGKGGEFEGFAINVDDKKRAATIRKAKKSCGVKYIAQDQWAKIAACNTQQNSGWCLAKIPQLNNQYAYASSAGSGATVYVIDTGCNWTHPDINGRISLLVNFVSSEDYYDRNGHGTATVSLVGGYSSGAAKSASLVCVKAMNAQGTGAYSDIINAVNWVGSQNNKGILSMSLAGGKYQAMNDAIQSAYNQGHLPIVAAGNNYQDANNFSPASAPNAVTVGSIDSSNKWASFSNFGSVVDLAAPGVSCNCASAPSNGIGQSSGTSISTPIVAGVAAVIQAQNGWNNDASAPSKITNALLSAAKSNQISNVPAGTVNKLLFWNNCN